jgi:hypothetical protein
LDWVKSERGGRERNQQYLHPRSPFAPSDRVIIVIEDNKATIAFEPLDQRLLLYRMYILVEVQPCG